MSLWFKIGILLILISVVAFVLAAMPSWFYHPLGVCTGSTVTIRDCKGYNSWSGIFSDIGEITLIGGMVTIVLGLWHQHNCHVAGCPWLCWHVHPDHGHPVCKKHHPHHEAGAGDHTHVLTADGLEEVKR